MGDSLTKSDGSYEALTPRTALTLCPQHNVEDACWADALERAWQRLKVTHAADCTRTDCSVSDEHVTIVHGNCGVTATTFYWHRGECWTG